MPKNKFALKRFCASHSFDASGIIGHSAYLVFMSANMQEIKRYIKQMGEVVVYYRAVTNADKDKPEGGNKDE